LSLYFFSSSLSYLCLSSKSSFIQNAGNNGGAISFGLDTAISDFKGSLDITDSLFYKNVARFGGGGAVKVNEVIGTISFSQVGGMNRKEIFSSLLSCSNIPSKIFTLYSS
jgi:hypothetical protein